MKEFSKLIVFLFFWSYSHAFFEEFAIFHDRQAIKIYFNKTSTTEVRTWFRRVIKNDNMLPFLFLNKHHNESQTRLGDLNVYIPDGSSINSVNKNFQKIYSERPRNDNSFWLFDISLYISLENWQKHFQSLNVNLNEDLYLYYFENTTKPKVLIWECYRVHPTMSMKIVPYGTWSKQNGLSINSNEKWIRRKDLEGIHFLTNSKVETPYTMIVRQRNPNEVEFGIDGLFPDVWHSLQEILNFTYTLNLPPDNQWGSLQSNGQWNGMIKELRQKRIDIAIATLAITLERSQAVSFAYPIVDTYNQIFIPNFKGINYMALVEPLNTITWMFIGFSCIVAPPFLYITTHTGGKDPDYQSFTLIKSVIFMLYCFALRDWHTTPTKTSARIAFLVIMTFGLLINLAWQANLISYLTISKIFLPFTNFESLVKTSDFQIAIVPGTSDEDLFKLSLNPIYQRAWKERIEPNLEEYKEYGYTNIVQILRKHQSMAVVISADAAKFTKEYMKCEVINIPSKFNFNQYAFGFQKDSQYLPIFNYYLKQLDQQGTFHKLYNKYQVLPQNCQGSGGNAIGFESTLTAFLAFIVGMVLGMVLLIIERLYILIPWRRR